MKSRLHSMIKFAGTSVALALLAPAAVAQVCPDSDSDPPLTYLGTGSGESGCWIGDTYETGTTLAHANVSVSGGTRYIKAYRYSGATLTAYALGFNSLYNPDCEASDPSNNQTWGSSVACSADLRWVSAVAGSGGRSAILAYMDQY